MIWATLPAIYGLILLPGNLFSFSDVYECLVSLSAWVHGWIHYLYLYKNTYVLSLIIKVWENLKSNVHPFVKLKKCFFMTTFAFHLFSPLLLSFFLFFLKIKVAIPYLVDTSY